MDYFDKFTQPVSEHNFAGRDLEDSDELEMLLLDAKGSEEQYSANFTKPAEPPPWENLRNRAFNLLSDSRDLRVLGVLAQASLNLNRLDRFNDCLMIAEHWLQHFWAELFPAIDEEDGAYYRAMALLEFADRRYVENTLSTYELASHRGFSVNKLSLSANENDDEYLSESAITQIFAKTESEALIVLVDTISQCAMRYEYYVARLTQQEAESNNLPNLEPLFRLASLLNEILNQIKRFAGNRCLSNKDFKQVDDKEEGRPSIMAKLKMLRRTPTSDSDPQPPHIPHEETDMESNHPASTTLRSREDVENALERICEYFAQYEPSSPIPLLMRRARRLLHLEFIDIIKDLAPDAVEHISRLEGEDETAKAGAETGS